MVGGGGVQPRQTVSPLNTMRQERFNLICWSVEVTATVVAKEKLVVKVT